MNYAGQEKTWCLVGNVIDGKNLSSGSKVYCLPPQWGDGYKRVQVIGKKTKRNVKIVMKIKNIENLRAQELCSPSIIDKMDCFWESKEQIENIINGINDSN